MQSHGSGIVLPPGSVKRVVLSGEELQIKIIGHHHHEYLVEYPDGYRRFHQAHDMIALLAKISGQLKSRYNLNAFEFKDVPQGLPSETINIGGIKYA